MFALDWNPEILTCGPFRAQGYTQYYHTNMFGAFLEEEDGEQGEGAGVASGLEPASPSCQTTPPGSNPKGTLPCSF
ncbi:hypothetical protein Tco_0668549 [Tanacetum coccineum]